MKRNPRHLPGIFYLAVLFMLSATGAAQQAPTPGAKVIDWKRSFGKVEQGTPVTFRYQVVNTGDRPLIFTRAEVSCTCTKAELPVAPLLPRDTAVITVTFDTKSAYGLQDRTVQVYTNMQGEPLKLRFRGNVRRK